MSATREPSDVNARLARLSDGQRVLLEKRLLEQRVAIAAASQIPRRDVLSPVPLSYSQELLWLLSQLEARGVAYNAPAAFRLHGPIDAGALQSALDGIVARHEILRTTYELVDDRPMQIVSPSGSVELRLVDLSDLQEEEQEAELLKLLHAESEYPFDLRVDSIIRPFLIRMGPDDHVFFNVMHHVATDGWSRAVLHGDLTELYEAALEQREPQLPPLKIQYADYAAWHRRWLDDGVLEQQLGHWKETLRGAPSRLELPTDRARPAVRAYEGDHTSRMISMEVRRRLEEIARAGDGTLFMSLLTAFSVLLHRYSGQDDIVIGTPFAGRHRSELESMIGYFINPLALRIDASDDPSFTELLSRARETTLSAFAHADVPYEMVVRATTPERDLSQTPVFQVMMVLHNPEWERKRPKFEPKGVTATELVHEKGWAKFDLLLGMSQRAAGLNTTWEYSTELFDHATGVRIGRHFEKLLDSIASDPERPISRLPMLLDDERSVILSRWSKAPAEFPSGPLVKDLFEEWASRTPTADAVVIDGERLTYEELDTRANRLAHRLQNLGVGPGKLVGIYMTKSLDLVVAVLAVIKAGGAYVPLDPMYPEDRIAFMLEDARPAVLVTAGDLPPAAALDEIAVVDWDGLDDESASPLATVATADDLAYMIYTSGSTGRPRGSLITNGSLVNAFYAYDEAYRLTDETTSHLQMASFSFDVFTGDFIRSLLSGSKLVLCPLEVVLEPAALYALITSEGVDCAEFVPAVATLLFEHVESVGATLDLRVLVVSSEGWRTDRHEFYRRLSSPRTRLINAYGLTEATIDSTYFEAEADLLPDRFVPIGRPLANSVVYILDRNLELVPPGIPGELCIGGSGVALGYLNRPELTAERFVESPFDSGGRLYRTGDLARWLPDGNVEFLGRADRQLKIRGFRIEPGEIEAVLERHPDVRTAAVIPWERQQGSPVLAAFVEPLDTASPPDTRELRELVSAELPAFMVPATFTTIDAFPVTPNGKLDRSALPAPDLSHLVEERVEPRDERERALVAIWQEVLELSEPIGVTEDFFSLGGHSLLAVRLLSRVERAFGTKLPLATLFEEGTVERMAQRVEDLLGEETRFPTLTPLKSSGTRPPLFLLHGHDGELLIYKDLVNALSTDQPVYGIQPVGLDGRELPLLSVHDMAAHYVSELRRFAPEGPYLLCGYCFSGVLAYEVAHQLSQHGHAPALLALIDARPLGHRQSATRIELERAKYRDFREADLRGKGRWIVRRVKGVGYKIRRKANFAVYDYLGRGGRWVPRSLVDVRWAILRAVQTYRTPSSSAVSVTLLRAADGHVDDHTIRETWATLARQVVVREISAPGIQHDNIVREPYVGLLAAELEAAIESALTEEAAAGPGERPADVERAELVG